MSSGQRSPLMATEWLQRKSEPIDHQAANAGGAHFGEGDLLAGFGHAAIVAGGWAVGQPPRSTIQPPGQSDRGKGGIVQARMARPTIRAIMEGSQKGTADAAFQAASGSPSSIGSPMIRRSSTAHLSSTSRFFVTMMRVARL